MYGFNNRREYQQHDCLPVEEDRAGAAPVAPANGGRSSMVEPWIVDPKVAGSNPVGHPININNINNTE
jgi:hypothetical protein